VNLLKLSENDYDANFNTTDTSKVRYGCLFIAAGASEPEASERRCRPNLCDLCSQACAVDAQ
jgi:hypothetical protein